MKKGFLSKLMTVVLTVGVLAGTAVTAHAEEQVVHLGDQPSFFILKIADDLGYFDEQFKDSGVKISVDNFVNQGSAIIEAMSAGDVELGVVGSLPFVAAVANGNDFVALSSVNISENGFKLFAGKDSGVEKTEDFKGKKVAVKFSSNEHQMLLTLLDNAGLSTDDVEVTNMSAEDGLNALINGDVDGAVLRGDQLKPAEDSGAITIADNSESGAIVNYLIAQRKFAEENPEIIDGVLQVLERAKQWIEENPEETVDRYVALTDTDKDTAQVNFESRVRSISIDPPKFADTLQQAVDFSVGQEIIDSPLNVEDLIDTSYYENSGISDE